MRIMYLTVGININTLVGSGFSGLSAEGEIKMI